MPARSLLTGAGSRGVLRNIASGRFSFPARLDLSAEIKDLIGQMLIVDPARRIPIAQIPGDPSHCTWGAGCFLALGSGLGLVGTASSRR